MSSGNQNTGMNNYFMMKSQKPQMGGGYMPAQRTSVQMSATAGAMPQPSVTGSMPEVLDDYMKDIDKIKDASIKSMEELKEKMAEKIKEGANKFQLNMDKDVAQTVMESRSLVLEDMMTNRPQKTAKIENIIDGKVVKNTYKPKDPYKAKVVFNETLTGPDAGEVVHVVFETEGNLPYIEGQSIGVVAPGEDAKGKPHKLRLYSIASSAPGDYGDGKTVSLCVKRLIYEDDEGKEVRGVCSNYIADLKAGDEVNITGPVGEALLLPKDPNANIIMLATGTGIAPFRSFLWRFFLEEHPEYKFDGKAWLFLGVPTTSALLYDEEFKKMKELGGDKFQYDYAISRE